MPFIPLAFFTSKLCKRSSTSSSLHKRSSGHSPGMQLGMSSSHNCGTVELKHFNLIKKFSFSSVMLPDSVGLEDFCCSTTLMALENTLLFGFRLLKNSVFLFLSLDTTLFQIFLYFASCSSPPLLCPSVACDWEKMSMQQRYSLRLRHGKSLPSLYGGWRMTLTYTTPPSLNMPSAVQTPLTPACSMTLFIGSEDQDQVIPLL